MRTAKPEIIGALTLFSIFSLGSAIAQERRTFRSNPVPHFPPDKPFSESACELTTLGQKRFRQWLSAYSIAQYSKGKVIDAKTAECLRVGLSADDRDKQQVALGILQGATPAPGVALPSIHSLAKSGDPTIVQEVLNLYENPSFLPGTREGLSLIAPLIADRRNEISMRTAKVLAKRDDLAALTALPEHVVIGLQAGELLLASDDAQTVALGAELLVRTKDSSAVPRIIRKALEQNRLKDEDPNSRYIREIQSQLLHQVGKGVIDPDVVLFKALVQLEGLTSEHAASLVKLLQDQSDERASTAEKIIEENPKFIPDVLLETSSRLKEFIWKAKKDNTFDSPRNETFTFIHPYPGVERLWKALKPHGDFEAFYGKNSALNEAVLRVGGSARIFGKQFPPDFIKKVIGQERGYLRRLAIVSFFTPDRSLSHRHPDSEKLPPFVMELLVSELRSPDAETRSATLRALKELPYVETKLEEYIEQALGDPDRRVAAWAALRHGSPRVRQIREGEAFSRALRTALESTDPELAREALSILPRSTKLPSATSSPRVPKKLRER